MQSLRLFGTEGDPVQNIKGILTAVIKKLEKIYVCCKPDKSFS
jgi:hypothetical protein